MNRCIADRSIIALEPPTQIAIAGLQVLRIRLRSIFTAPDNAARPN